MTPFGALNAALNKAGGGIRLVSPDEIHAWSAVIRDASKHMKAIIDDWSIVVVTDLGLERLHLVGNVVDTTKIRTTSPILRVDLKAGFVLTLSESFYKLGTPHEGEPTVEQVFAMAKAIVNWRASQGRAGFNYYH